MLARESACSADGSQAEEIPFPRCEPPKPRAGGPCQNCRGRKIKLRKIKKINLLIPQLSTEAHTHRGTFHTSRPSECDTWKKTIWSRLCVSRSSLVRVPLIELSVVSGVPTPTHMYHMYVPMSLLIEGLYVQSSVLHI